MSLEERIRRFAQQARDYLLEEFEKSTQKDTSVVQWQGFNEDGKLTVKDGDLSPVVKGVGHKYPNNNSKLILDTAGSVEQRKSSKKKGSRLAATRPVDVKVKDVPVIPFVPRSAIVALLETEDEQGTTIDKIIAGTYLIFTEYPWGRYDDDYESFSDDLETENWNSINTSVYFSPNLLHSESEVEQMWYFGTLGYTVRTGSPIDSSYSPPPNDPAPHTSYITVGAPFNLNASITSSAGEFFRTNAGHKHIYGQVTDYSGSYQVDISMEDDHQIDYRLYGFYGWAHLSYDFRYMAFKKQIYRLTSSPINGESQSTVIDLKNYIDDLILYADIVHNYVTSIKVDDYNAEQVAFLIIEVHTVNMNQTDFEETSSVHHFTGDIRENEAMTWIGEKKHFVLHLKVNLTRGTVEHRKAQVTEDYRGDLFTEGWSVTVKNGVEYLLRLRGDGLWGGAYSSIVTSYTSYPLSPTQYFRNAFEGDWLYEFRNMTWDPSSHYNTLYDIYTFLNGHYYDGKWYMTDGYGFGINGGWLMRTGDTIYERAYVDTTSGLGAGQPVNNDVTDITNVVSYVQASSTTYSVETFFTEQRVGSDNKYSTWVNVTQNTPAYTYVWPDLNYQDPVPQDYPTTSDRVNGYFSYIQTPKFDRVGINSYSATASTIYINMALMIPSSANYVISGTNLIDGSYTVQNYDENSLVLELVNPTSNPIAPTAETQITGALTVQ